MDHPVAVCTSTVSKKRKIVWELESLNLIPIILDEEILVIKVEAYPTFYQTYFYQLTWFWHLGYKISLSVMDALTVMLFLPRCNPLPRIWMMRSGAALAKSALTCIAIVIWILDFKSYLLILKVLNIFKKAKLNPTTEMTGWLSFNIRISIHCTYYCSF